MTPHTTTGVAPAELMLRQQPHSHIDLIMLNLKDKITQQQQRQKSQHDKTTRQRIFQQDDLVMVYGFNKGLRNSWLPGIVASTNGEQSYKIKLADGKILRRHADHIYPRQGDCNISNQEDDIDDIPFLVSQQQPASTSAPTKLRHSQRSHRLLDHYQT